MNISGLDLFVITFAIYYILREFQSFVFKSHRASGKASFDIF